LELNVIFCFISWLKYVYALKKSLYKTGIGKKLRYRSCTRL